MRATPESPAAGSAPTSDPADGADARRREPRVLILAGDADGNLGDRAIVQGTCIGLREIRPGCEVAVVSSRPNGLGVAASVIPRGPKGLLRLCAAAARSDLVLCGGGGLFQDDDSLVKMPYWAARVWLARALCRRVVGYALGVGPLAAAPSRLAARIAFAAMERISVRDPLARETARVLTGKPVSVVADPALLVPATPPAEARCWLAKQGVPLGGPELVGVAVRRWFPPRPRLVPHHVRSRFTRGGPGLGQGSERLAALFAQVLDDVIETRDAQVLFLPSYDSPHEGDVVLCREIAKRMRRTEVHVLEIDDPSLYKGVTSELDVLLGGRMHPTILAASVGTPVVGLAYNPKFRGFFRLLDRDEFVMDVEDFVEGKRVEDLSALVGSALDGPPPVDRARDLAGGLRAFNDDILRDVP